MKKHRKTYKILDKIKQHIYNNFDLYIIVSIFFLIGIVGGVIFFNNIQTDVQKPINDHLKSSIESLKNNYQIDSYNLLKQTIINNMIFTVIIWFMGCTVIGIPLVYGLIAWKGFSLSYTIASIISYIGVGKGICFCTLSLLLQNIVIIPITLALGVSGNRLYRSIIKDKRKENIKMEIIRHTLFSLFMSLLLIIASFIETYMSSNLTQIFVIYMEI